MLFQLERAFEAAQQENVVVPKEETKTKKLRWLSKSF